MNLLSITMLSAVILMMISLGLDLRLADFVRVFKMPRDVLIGLFGQIVLLPLIAFALILLSRCDPMYGIGIMLVACTPGGSSSNFFTAAIKGNVALSVSLTGISNLLAVITMPLIMAWTFSCFQDEGRVIHLSFWKTAKHMCLTSFFPLIAAMYFRHRWSGVAERLQKPIASLAFLLLVAAISAYLYTHLEIVVHHGPRLIGILSMLIVVAMSAGYLLALICGMDLAARKAVAVEIGIQNAGQSIVIAVHPLLLNDPSLAFPAMIYGLAMYFFVFTYLYGTRWWERRFGVENFGRVV